MKPVIAILVLSIMAATPAGAQVIIEPHSDRHDRDDRDRDRSERHEDRLARLSGRAPRSRQRRRGRGADCLGQAFPQGGWHTNGSARIWRRGGEGSLRGASPALSDRPAFPKPAASPSWVMLRHEPPCSQFCPAHCEGSSGSSMEENMKTLAIITALLLAATTLVATTGDASANKKGSHYRCYSGC